MRSPSKWNGHVGYLPVTLARRIQDPESGAAKLPALFIILSLVTIGITVVGVSLSLMKPTHVDASTTNQNIVGGNIPFLSKQTDCLAVNDSVGKVQVGDQIQVAECGITAASQRWSYGANLQLRIAGTNGTTLCMQATDSVSAGTNVKGSKVVLATCSANALPPASPYTPYYQLWSYNNSGQFQNSKTDDTGLGLYCLKPVDKASGGISIGDLIDLDSCGVSGQFVPAATVGAGAAGSAVRPFQLVNYLNFGRCVDVTSQWQTANWLIGYPCKQDPLATNLTWNQKFYTGISDGAADSGATAAYGGHGTDTVIATSKVGCQISATTACQFITFPDRANGTDKSLTAAQKIALANPYFCLEAGSTANPMAPINGTIVTVQPCRKTDNYQKWTYTRSAGSNYAGKYLIQPYGAGASNLCLSMTIGSTPPGLTYNGAGGVPIIPAYGYISLQTCTGTGWQKWNAPANP